MKTFNKSIIALLLAVSMLGLQATNPNHLLDKGARIKLSKESHNFGEVQDGEIVDHIFTVTNVGDSVLKIHKLTGS